MSAAGGAGTRVARAVVRHRVAIALAWVAAALLLVPRAARLDDVLETGARVQDSESARVDRLVAGPLRSAFAEHVVLVVGGLPSPRADAGATELRAIVDTLRAHPRVSGAFSWLDWPDSLLLGAGGRGALVVVGLREGNEPADAAIPALRAARERMQERLRARFGEVSLRWTGQAALNVDLREASARDVARAERRALPVAGLLLLFAFGALAAAAIPLLFGALAIVLALGASAIAAEAWPMSILLQSVVPMLGLGLGIDYALLMVSRFRDALGAYGDPVAAAEEAARHAGHTILLSSATVALGFVVLLSVPLNEMRAIAAGGLLVVAACALLTTTLLPGLLAALGRRVDLGRVRAPRSRQRSMALWRRWARVVTAHPWTALAAGGLPLALLAWQATGLRTGLPRGDWLPASMESARALDDLWAMGRGGSVQAVRVIVMLPAQSSLWEPAGWQAIARYGRALEARADVARVRSPTTTAEALGLNLRALQLLGDPSRIARGLATPDGRTVLIEVVPAESVSPEGAVQLVRALRRSGAAPLGIATAELLVGGLPALNADYHDAVAGRFTRVVVLVVAGTFVALLIGFRSLLVPVKAVLLNLLSVGAAFGAVKLVFQDGHGAALLGVAEPMGAVFSSVPMVVFCIVFGLSMDYEVFLIARVREERLAGRDDRAAIVEGVGRTGQVISNAAAIMLVVFAAFMLGEVLVVKVLGFALAVTVLLDATLVRMVLGPALLQLAGRWNWWPTGAGRVRPAPHAEAPVAA